MSTLRVVGLDLSLTCTGLSDGLVHEAIRTGPHEVMEARLDRLVRGVVSFVVRLRVADLAVIEAPAFSRTGPGHEELAALRCMVRHRLWRLAVPFALVPPTTLKLYTTGHGAASKAAMVDAVDGRHGAALGAVRAAHGRYDMADALALAAMGYDHVGQPLPQRFPAPPPHRKSLAAVSWPDLLSD